MHVCVKKNSLSLTHNMLIACLFASRFMFQQILMVQSYYLQI